MFCKLKPFLLIVFVVGPSLTACAPKATTLWVEAGQVRALLPGRDTTAGYFKLHNQTQAAVTLVGASSSAARSIEMHKTVQRDGSVGMQRVEQITIAPDEILAFEPGGLHLMIFGVTEVTEEFPITLNFSNGEQLNSTFSKLAL